MENNNELQLHEQQKGELNYIEETVLKKRKSSEEWAIRRKQQLLERKWQNKQDKKLAFKRAEQFIAEFRNKELDLVNLKHRSKRRKTDAVSSKLLFVIRIQQGRSDIHPQVKKILNSLCLRKNFSGVFLEASEVNLAMLQKVEPYVTYGHPNLKHVKDLITKKGNLKLEKQMVPLTDNNIIEQALEKYDIICIEDIIHEIANVGPNFNQLMKFLWPFNLTKPDGDLLKGKKNPYMSGGDSGNRGVRISELLDKMI